MQVLVVDDEPIIALVLREILIDDGCQVDLARTGTEALRILQNIPVPDVILLDISLPDMSGCRVVEAIRSNPAFNATAIILISAYGIEQQVFPDPTMYQALINKPFDVEDVVKQVHHYCPTK
jgi:CheY-like chemotaxis protein